MPPFRLLMALTESADLNAWVQFAHRLCPQDQAGVTTDCEIILRGLISVPADESASASALPARIWRDELYRTAMADDTINDDARVYVDYAPFNTILDEVEALAVDLLIVQWSRPTVPIGGLSSNAIMRRAACDVAFVDRRALNQRGNVLLSLRGGPNLTLGVQVSRALVETQNPETQNPETQNPETQNSESQTTESTHDTITVFHATDRREFAPDLERILRNTREIGRTVTAVTNIEEGILREGDGHRAIVMGAGLGEARTPDTGTTSMLDVVAARTDKPLILVRAGRQESFEFHSPAKRSTASLPVVRPLSAAALLSARVDRWFAENTFHSSEFDGLGELMRLKERQGTTITVTLPTLNEEETIADVIGMVQTSLMRDVPLVDELVLIDSNSTDSTVAIAESLGVPVFRHPDILADEVGSVRGKGEALWKSLHVTRGDIIAWIDTDITNVHPRFVYGLLGPLLKHPRIQYVKGFYTRPIQVNGQMQASGGGRVTELVARPMFNLFYPELSGVIQPLSGEYAGRRSALERLPFFSGYGVETGLLIDLLETFGLDAIAQSDLEVRIHHNQPLTGLSKMSFAILQVFMNRLGQRAGAPLLDLTNASMKLVIQEPERFALDIQQIGDVERQPMIQLPAYQQRELAPLSPRSRMAEALPNPA